MATLVTSNELSGRATGALFFTGFGALWLLLSLYTRQALTLAAVTPVVLIALGLAAAALALKRRAASLPGEPENPEVGMAFGRINALEWAAIFVVAFVLSRLHLDAYTPSAIVAIVGLHMFPLARLFHYPLHYASGSMLIAWAVTSIFVAPVEQLQTLACLGSGILLWINGAITLALAFRAARTAERSLSEAES